MPRKITDMVGKRFGHLVVLREHGKKRGRYHWVCQCDCGRTSIVDGAHLRNGNTQSCGCMQRGNIDSKARNKSDHRLNSILWHMRQRCYDKNVPQYARYGGRGIYVCDEWMHGSSAFRKWAYANGYRDDLSIDRIDNDGPYSPENCRWTTASEQARNTSVTRYFQGVSLPDWCDQQRLDLHMVKQRIIRGWSIEEALELSQKTKTSEKCSAVLMLKNGQELARFNSIADAARHIGKDPYKNGISLVCRGKRHSACGYQWRYAEEVNP